MLHILLFILKIIGILLAVILGIIVLCICAVLFVPICYRAEGAGSGTLEDAKLHGQVSWLFGLVKVVVDIRNKIPEYYIKIAWKRLGGPKKPAQEREDAAYEKHAEEQKDFSEIREETDHNRKAEEIRILEEPEEPAEVPAKENENRRESQKTPEKESQVSDRAQEETESHGRVSGISDKIKGICEKIKCTIRKFCDKIRSISEKKDRLAEFISDETHLHAFEKAKQEVFRLLRRLSPRVLKANIHYGFEDPGLTGKVLACLSILYPFVGEHAQITPDFQEEVLEGEIRLRGRIFIVHLAALAVNMLLCRDVRRTIKDVKEFRL